MLEILKPLKHKVILVAGVIALGDYLGLIEVNLFILAGLYILTAYGVVTLVKLFLFKQQLSKRLTLLRIFTTFILSSMMISTLFVDRIEWNRLYDLGHSGPIRCEFQDSFGFSGEGYYRYVEYIHLGVADIVFNQHIYNQAWMIKEHRDKQTIAAQVDWDKQEQTNRFNHARISRLAYLVMGHGLTMKVGCGR